MVTFFLALCIVFGWFHVLQPVYFNELQDVTDLFSPILQSKIFLSGILFMMIFVPHDMPHTPAKYIADHAATFLRGAGNDTRGARVLLRLICISPI
jgi:hypothetical protein